MSEMAEIAAVSNVVNIGHGVMHYVKLCKEPYKSMMTTIVIANYAPLFIPSIIIWYHLCSWLFDNSLKDDK